MIFCETIVILNLEIWRAEGETFTFGRADMEWSKAKKQMQRGACSRSTRALRVSLKMLTGTVLNSSATGISQTRPETEAFKKRGVGGGTGPATELGTKERPGHAEQVNWVSLSLVFSRQQNSECQANYQQKNVALLLYFK